LVQWVQRTGGKDIEEELLDIENEIFKLVPRSQLHKELIQTKGKDPI